MDHLVHEFRKSVVGPDGRRYRARAYGRERDRHERDWIGWLEFEADGAVLATGHETTQPTYRTLEYWAEGLEPVYLQGALARAERHARDRELAVAS